MARGLRAYAGFGISGGEVPYDNPVRVPADRIHLLHRGRLQCGVAEGQHWLARAGILGAHVAHWGAVGLFS